MSRSANDCCIYIIRLDVIVILLLSLLFNNITAFIITGCLSEVRTVRDPWRAVVAQLSAHHLAFPRVPFVIADGAPFSQVHYLHVTCNNKNFKKIVKSKMKTPRLTVWSAYQVCIISVLKKYYLFIILVSFLWVA